MTFSLFFRSTHQFLYKPKKRKRFFIRTITQKSNLRPSIIQSTPRSTTENPAARRDLHFYLVSFVGATPFTVYVASKNCGSVGSIFSFL